MRELVDRTMSVRLRSRDEVYRIESVYRHGNHQFNGALGHYCNALITLTVSVIQSTQNYHAVNPNAKEGEASQRRNQIIEESKFLGGDIEHTHLVKGLDYALLHKVKAEIYNKENQDDDVEGIVTQKTPTIAGDAVKKAGMATGNAAEKLRGTAVCRHVLGGGKAC